jgi:hypothetical protein
MGDTFKSSVRHFFRTIHRRLRQVTIVSIPNSPPLKPLKTRNAAPLLQLPVDLLFLINEELRPVDRLALLLTCRSLLHVLPSIESIPLTESQRTDFLVRLERDLNDQHALCTSCGVLRRFTKDETPNRQYCGSLCEAGSFLPMEDWTNGTRRLGYVDARLMVNHHWSGGQIGLSPNQYSMTKPQVYFTRGVFRSISVQLKFVGDELMIKATHRVHSKSLQEGKPAGQLYTHILCVHHKLLDSLSWETSGVLSLWPPAVSFPLAGPPRMTHGCYECLSDWEIQDERGQDDKIVAITAQSYHLLGRVLLHSSPTWQALITLFQPHPQPRNHTRNLRKFYPVGRIASMWKQGQAIKRYGAAAS